MVKVIFFSKFNLMDDFELLDILDDITPWKHNPKISFAEYLSNISDSSFYEGYRMTKECFCIIFSRLKYTTKCRGNFFDPEFELLTLLRYLPTGSFMLISGNLF